MSVSLAIDKTFFEPDISHIGKRTNHKFVKVITATNDCDSDPQLNGKPPQKKKKDDNQRHSHFGTFKPNKKEDALPHAPGQETPIIVSRKSMDNRAGKSSNLNSRKLKENKPEGNSNMILLIPGVTGGLSRSPSRKSSKRSRKSSNVTKENQKSFIEQEQEESEQSKTNIYITNVIMMPEQEKPQPKTPKILIPQSEKLKEFDEELRKEARKLVIESKVIDIMLLGKRKMRFLLDKLRIEKLNSIKELGMKMEDLKLSNQAVGIFKDANVDRVTQEKQLRDKESNIIIINQNEFNNCSSPSNKPLKRVKTRILCCIPVK